MVAPRISRPGLLTATLALIFVATSAGAQTLGSAFTYQGHLTDSNVTASGLFDLQVCIYDVASGSNPLQCAPDYNDVPVDEGVFTLAVDFGSNAFIGQQRFLELRVRPGASTAAYTVLAPRQLVRAAPEALRANVASAAPWSGLTGMPTGFADGIDNVGSGVSAVFTGGGLTGGPITTSGTIGIAGGGVVSNMIALGAVGILNLADNSVNSARIVDDSISVFDIAPNAISASELNNNSVDTAAIQDAQVTAAKIAPGAIGAAQIDPTQVQARVSGTCGDGEFFRGINPDGSLECELLPVTSNRVLDFVGDVGSHVALVLRADQRPLIAYHDQTNGNLKLYDCADPACASGTRRVLDSNGDVGENIAMVIGPDGLPVIAYRNVSSESLRFYACADSSCSSGAARTLDSTLIVRPYVGMALRANGRPLIAYLASGLLRIFDCADAGCSSGTARAAAGTSGADGVSIAVRADGRALVALGGNAGVAIQDRLYDCSDSGCTAGTARLLTFGNHSGVVSLLIRSDGRPLIAGSGLFGRLRMHDCADPLCVASTVANFEIGNTDALATAMRADGRALIVFGKSSGATDLRVFDCSNASCTAGSSRSLVAGGDYGAYAAMALRDDGRPVIVHYDADNGDLRLHICANAECT